MAFHQVDSTIERCGRDVVRVEVPNHPDVSIRKGSTAKIVFGSNRNDFHWHCEVPHGDSDREHSSSSRAFNAVIIARHAEGRRMDIYFGLEA
jgi:hypothetical protein